MDDENDIFLDEEDLDIDAFFPAPVGVLPPALIKALCDPFDYALGMRNGQVIHFCEARLIKGGKWIHLTGNGLDIKMSGVDHGFPRGLDVRLSDIAWVADAPDGS